MTDQEYQQMLFDMMFNPPAASGGTDYTQLLQAQAILARREAEQAARSRHEAADKKRRRQEEEHSLLEATHGLAAVAANRPR